MKNELLAILLLLTAAINATAIDYVVKGNIDGFDGKKIYIRDYDNRTIIDSTFVMDRSFIFKGSYERPALVRIGAENKWANCILDSIIVLDFNIHRPISGSTLNNKLVEFMVANQKIDDELHKFEIELKDHGFKYPELGEIYNHLYVKLRPAKLQLYYNTIAENANGVGEAAVMSLGNEWELTFDEWDTAYSKMSPYLKDRQITKRFNHKFTSLRKAESGNPFINFSAKDVDGKDVKLSDYVGNGKYVLLDFWASWCGPCQKEAETTLLPLYDKYQNDDRFMILGVATSDEHTQTLNALKRLHYPWQQLIDAGKKPMEIYGFDSLPQLILIGPDGTIIERELRGEGIISLVNNILSNNKPNQ
ncbi:MAG: AhpC/TSA family protein [Muribaculaceae bacterium]|uniref:TlpA disulfide reductase family protein n=1 Tax=uncultured Duncaniella sp. TaxID=2768039 RepID=UPI00260A75D4|nr:TlpA disulfide reductase family protein [uncultured Duncaniella sp.]MCI8999173.1 AhpC/TSA family protein [Muribaculaceae bacterium]